MDLNLNIIMCNRIISVIGNIVLFIFMLLVYLGDSSKEVLIALFVIVLYFNSLNLSVELFNLSHYYWNKFKK